MGSIGQLRTRGRGTDEGEDRASVDFRIPVINRKEEVERSWRRDGEKKGTREREGKGCVVQTQLFSVEAVLCQAAAPRVVLSACSNKLAERSKVLNFSFYRR